MDSTVTIQTVQQVPSDARVRHIDELGWEAKSHLSECEPGESVDVIDSVAEEFGGCDVVKYTDYYEVKLS